MEDDLAYADVFTLQRERVPAELLVNLLLERIAVLDSPAPGSHKALRSVIAVSESARDEARARTKVAPRTKPVPLRTERRPGRCTAYPFLSRTTSRSPAAIDSGATSLAGRVPGRRPTREACEGRRRHHHWDNQPV